jgi:hypothetical protein
MSVSENRMIAAAKNHKNPAVLNMIPVWVQFTWSSVRLRTFACCGKGLRSSGASMSRLFYEYVGHRVPPECWSRDLVSFLTDVLSLEGLHGEDSASAEPPAGG